MTKAPAVRLALAVAVTVAAVVLFYLYSSPTYPNPGTTQKEVSGVSLIAYTAGSGPIQELPLQPNGYEIEFEIVEETACFYVAAVGEPASRLAMIWGSEIEATVTDGDPMEVSVGDLTLIEGQPVPFNPPPGDPLPSLEYGDACEKAGVGSSFVWPIWQ